MGFKEQFFEKTAVGGGGGGPQIVEFGWDRDLTEVPAMSADIKYAGTSTNEAQALGYWSVDAGGGLRHDSDDGVAAGAADDLEANFFFDEMPNYSLMYPVTWYWEYTRDTVASANRRYMEMRAAAILNDSGYTPPGANSNAGFVRVGGQDYVLIQGWGSNDSPAVTVSDTVGGMIWTPQGFNGRHTAFWGYTFDNPNGEFFSQDLRTHVDAAPDPAAVFSTYLRLNSTNQGDDYYHYGIIHKLKITGVVAAE